MTKAELIKALQSYPDDVIVGWVDHEYGDFHRIQSPFSYDEKNGLLDLASND